MRVPVRWVCLALLVSSASAEPLSPADREVLLGTLEQLKENADSQVDERYRAALGAYRDAAASDEAALDLYLKCVEKVNFTDQKKKSSEFRDWKKSQGDKLGEQGFKTALRCQLQWLILTLRASSKKVEASALAPDAQEVVDAIFNNAEKLKGQEQVLNQSVIGTVFAKAYGIEAPEKNKWPLSPVQLDAVYRQVVFPPLQSSGRYDALRAAWIKRIRQEQIKIEEWHSSGQNEKRLGMASRTTPELDRFQEETLPELQWQMELDLFQSGDERDAARRMLAHIQKHLSHRSSRAWADAFKNLLMTPAAKTPEGASGAK